MHKQLKLTLLGIFLVALLVGGYYYFSQSQTPEEYAAHPECYDGGGVWTMLPDSSVDKCNYGGAAFFAFTEGCDCGPEKCWDGEKCVKNP